MMLTRTVLVCVMLTRTVLVCVILSAWSIHPSESSIAFNRSVCHDASVPGVTGMIVGGEVAPRDKWPWLAAFVVKSNNKFFCAGSLISERFVLTAAHCIQYKKEEKPRDPKDVNVYLGKWNLSDATEQDVVLATLTEFMVHHDWNVADKRWDADIAIAKLAVDVTFSRSVQPVCLWTSQMQPDEANDGGIVVGWGKTEEDRKHSEVPRDVKMLRLPVENCYEVDGLRDVISRRGLCIGGNGKGPCHGDSGGGFFTARGGKWFLRGITSAALFNVYKECNVNAPAVVTNVEKFIPWIDQALDEDRLMECKFGVSWDDYTCRLQNSFTREDTKIFQVIGSHVGGQTNADVRWFRIEHNKELKFLPITLGRFFPSLDFYIVDDSGLEKISRNNFADMTKLKVLWIIASPLKVIPVDAFYDLAYLEELQLSLNQIEAIHSTTLIHNTKLQVIELQHNKIAALDSSTFRNNLELRRIDFSGNLLTLIGPELLTPMEKLFYVGFGANTCIDRDWGRNGPMLTPSQKEEFKEKIASKCQ